MLSKQDMKAYYDAIFSDYFRYIQRFQPGILSHPVLEYYTALKLRYLDGHDVGDLLDLGCGTAFYYPLLTKYAKTITGIDYSSQMVTISQEFLKSNHIDNASVHCMDMEELDFQGRRFDTILSMDVFHHAHDLQKIIDHVQRLLKPNGLFLVVEVNPNHPLALAHNLYRPEERGVVRTFPWRLIPLLRRSFRIESVHYLQYFPFFLTKTPPRLLPAIRILELFFSRLPLVRRLSVYYIVKCRALTLAEASVIEKQR